MPGGGNSAGTLLGVAKEWSKERLALDGRDKGGLEVHVLLGFFSYRISTCSMRALSDECMCAFCSHTNPVVAGRHSTPCGHTGLATLAETPIPTGIKEDPRSPDEDTQGANASQQNSPMEIALDDDTDHAGLAEADLTGQSEQRALQELHRFQKHSKQTVPAERVEEPTARNTSATPQAAEPDQLPAPPPVTVYANLPTEWPRLTTAV